jgi:hypothetical protein
MLFQIALALVVAPRARLPNHSDVMFVHQVPAHAGLGYAFFVIAYRACNESFNSMRVHMLLGLVRVVSGVSAQLAVER